MTQARPSLPEDRVVLWTSRACGPILCSSARCKFHIPKFRTKMVYDRIMYSRDTKQKEMILSLLLTLLEFSNNISYLFFYVHFTNLVMSCVSSGVTFNGHYYS